MYNPFTNLPISCDWDCHIKRGSAGGIDFGVSVGYPIPASFAGTLRNVTNSVGGNIAVLTRDDGLMFMHDHLSRFVTPGNYNEGDIIGYSGGTKGAPGSGNSTGPHLHVNALENHTVRNPFDYWGTTQVASNSEKIIIESCVNMYGSTVGTITGNGSGLTGAWFVMAPGVITCVDASLGAYLASIVNVETYADEAKGAGKPVHWTLDSVQWIAYVLGAPRGTLEKLYVETNPDNKVWRA